MTPCEFVREAGGNPQADWRDTVVLAFTLPAITLRDFLQQQGIWSRPSTWPQKNDGWELSSFSAQLLLIDFHMQIWIIPYVCWVCLFDRFLIIVIPTLYELMSGATFIPETVMTTIQQRPPSQSPLIVLLPEHLLLAIS